MQADDAGWIVVCCGRKMHGVSDEEEEVAEYVHIVGTCFLGVMVGKNSMNLIVPSHRGAVGEKMQGWRCS